MQLSILKKNIGYSIFNYFIGNILRLIVRIVFIRTLSIEYLGLNGLFSNILAMLSLAELGIGPAIVYSLYEPLARKNKQAINSIMLLFRKTYIIIGLVILSLGLLVYPWLDCFLNTKPNIDDWKLFYLVFLLNTAVSYFWSYQRNLLIADQKQYYVNAYQVAIQFILGIIQILVLLFFESYWFYLVTMLIATISENVVISAKVNSMYPYLYSSGSRITNDKISEIILNTKAVLIHKFAKVIVLSSHSIILAKYVGLVAVGLYSNYLIVLQAVEALLDKLCDAITAIVGNAMIIDTDREKLQHFKIFELVTAWQASLFTVILYVLINPFISIWLGKEYLLDEMTVLLIVIAFYLRSMRKAVLVFRDACGLFWQDRYKAIVETIISISMSVYLARLYGIMGIVLGGIISTILTCLWLEPYILFRYGIKGSLKEYFVDYIKFLAMTLIGTTGYQYFWQCIPQNLYTFLFTGVFIMLSFSGVWWICFSKRISTISIEKSIL